MKEKITQSIRTFLPVAAAFLVTWMLVRVYEWFMIADRVESFAALSLTEATHWPRDLAVALQISWPLLCLHLIVGWVSPRGASRASRLLLGLLLLLTFAASQYFVITLIPIGADLFGYSTEDIVTTARSSGGTSYTTFIGLLVAGLLFVGITTWFERKKIFAATSWLVAPILLVAGLLFEVLPFRSEPEHFEDQLSYYISVNKLDYFVQRSRAHFAAAAPTVYGPADYPWLHPVSYEDPLRTLLPVNNDKPNIVLIIVEGLGRDFMGPDARYGGFTPYMDSLSTRSLFWSNALSCGGRTFAAPPSLLGSLPLAKDGFMNLGTNMPNHRTLISLLKPHGYQTNFFYGGNPNFDNLDLFLERQGVDRFINESTFPRTYADSHPKSSWGFQDADLFDFAISQLPPDSTPRLDVYLTLSTHEPFQAPDSTLAREARTLINQKEDPAYKANHGIFECLYYTDRAIARLHAYAQRADYDRTLFIITGDHRLIPMPETSPLARFHVPLIMFTPGLPAPQVLQGITSHAAVTPTLLAHLHSAYGLNFPDELPFVCGPVPSTTTFGSNLDMALMRNKNEPLDYIQGTNLMAQGRLYRIGPGLTLEPFSDATTRNALLAKARDYESRTLVAWEHNHLDSIQVASKSLRWPLSSTEAAFVEATTSGLVPDQQFQKARELAFAKQYGQSRMLLKNLLNKSPNFHDARLLMARTYGWQNHYDSAMMLTDEVLARAPMYADAWALRADIAFWKGDVKQSLQACEDGLQADNSNADLLVRKARALAGLGRKSEARPLLEQALKARPGDEEAQRQLQQLNNL